MLSGGGGLEIQAREMKRAWSGPRGRSWPGPKLCSTLMAPAGWLVQNSKMVDKTLPHDGGMASYSYTMDRHDGHPQFHGSARPTPAAISPNYTTNMPRCLTM